MHRSESCRGLCRADTKQRPTAACAEQRAASCARHTGRQRGWNIRICLAGMTPFQIHTNDAHPVIKRDMRRQPFLCSLCWVQSQMTPQHHKSGMSITRQAVARHVTRQLTGEGALIIGPTSANLLAMCMSASKSITAELRVWLAKRYQKKHKSLCMII